MSDSPVGGNARSYYLSRYVRYVDISGRVTILDIRSESYFSLEPLASMIWKELAAGHTERECYENIARDMPSSGQDTAEGIAAFIRQCLEAGLLTTSPGAFETHGSPDMAHPGQISAPGAWFILLRTTRSLSRKGFFRTYTEALDAPRVKNLTGASNENIAKALRAFSRAENFFHLKKAPLDCLPRSLSLYFFLRQSGLPAGHYIGIRQFPFTAHAWTECSGKVVHDDASNRDRFSVIARIDP